MLQDTVSFFFFFFFFEVEDVYREERDNHFFVIFFQIFHILGNKTIYRASATSALTEPCNETFQRIFVGSINLGRGYSKIKNNSLYNSYIIIVQYLRDIK
jgi:hypothetical protein